MRRCEEIMKLKDKYLFSCGCSDTFDAFCSADRKRQKKGRWASCLWQYCAMKRWLVEKERETIPMHFLCYVFKRLPGFICMPEKLPRRLNRFPMKSTRMHPCHWYAKRRRLSTATAQNVQEQRRTEHWPRPGGDDFISLPQIEFSPSGRHSYESIAQAHMQTCAEVIRVSGVWGKFNINLEKWAGMFNGKTFSIRSWWTSLSK